MQADLIEQFFQLSNIYSVAITFTLASKNLVKKAVYNLSLGVFITPFYLLAIF